MRRFLQSITVFITTHKTLSLVMTALAASLLGLTAWGLYAYHNHPDKILADAISQLTQAHSSKFSGTYSVMAKGVNGQPGTQKLAVTLNGHTAHGQASTDFTIKSSDLRLQGQLIAANHATFLRLNDVTTLANDLPATNSLLAPFTAQFKAAGSKLDGKWLKIDANKSPSLTPTCTNLLAAQALSTKERGNLAKLLSKHRFVTPSILPDEHKGEHRLKHLRLTFNKDRANAFAAELFQLEPFKSQRDCLGKIYSSPSQAALDDIIQADIELWADARTHSPVKAAVILADDKTITKSILDIELNKTVVISAPATSEVLEFKDLVQTILTGH